MHLELSDEQKLLRETLSRLLRNESTSERIRVIARQADGDGFDGRLWDALAESQVHMLRVRGELGSDASLMHAVIVAEEAGRHLASVPLVEAIVANRLLDALGAPCAELLARCASGEAIATLALHDVATNKAQLVPGGAVAQAILCIEDGVVSLWSGLESAKQPIHGAIPARTLDTLTPATRQRIDHPQAAALFRAAVEEWKLLNAAQVAAAGLRAVELAAAYASEREAFGKKIGTFQGVAHPLADALTDVQGAQLLCWRAADAIARGEPDAADKVSMAAWWSGQAARPAALKAMRVFGGYGMTLDYDAPLYFRRINAWSLCAGPADASLLEVADRLWSGATADLPDAGEIGIDFSWGPEGEAAAARMRAVCERLHDDRLHALMRDSIDGYDPDLYRELAEERLLYPDAPKELGGGGLSGTAAAAIRDVLGDYYWNMLPQSATELIAKIVLRFGTDTARREVLPQLFSGKSFATLCYTEPSGGSDIFSARTTAVQVGDEWLINGQKIFTSVGHRADFGLIIVRTAPDKYKGLTMFIVPLRQAGYQFTPIDTIGGEASNITFYSDVRVPDAYRIGEVNGGVKVMSLALTLEQSAGDVYLMSMRNVLRQALEWARDGSNGERPIARTDVRLALAETAVRIAVEDTINRRGIWGFEAGTLRKHEGPMAKLFGTESWVSCCARLLEVAAPSSLVIQRQAEGAIEWMMQRAIPSTIYGGTSEIQRSIIAEAGLGLPRSR